MMFLIFLVLVPLAEIYLLVHVAQAIGWAEALLILMFAGLLGLHYLRMGAHSFHKLLAGLLFLVPGFGSDVLALIVLFPPTRILLSLLAQKYFSQALQKGSVRFHTFRAGSFGSGPFARTHTGFETYKTERDVTQSQDDLFISDSSFHSGPKNFKDIPPDKIL